MAVAGLVRLRKHQLGRQPALGTVVAATRAYACRGVPTVDPGWTDPDVDAGSLDPVAPPYRTAGERTQDLTFNSLGYNDVPLIMCGYFGGAVAPTGGGRAVARPPAEGRGPSRRAVPVVASPTPCGPTRATSGPTASIGKSRPRRARAKAVAALAAVAAEPVRAGGFMPASPGNRLRSG